VTAGVRAWHTAAAAHVVLFSIRPHAVADRFAHPPAALESTQKGGAGSAALTQAAAIVAGQLGSHVGIEDVSLESDVTNETSLVLGRYLSPRLYVSYGISLTEQINTLKLRYTLGDHWTIKTEVGQGPTGQISGLDLVYSIDK
jgi:translocation and assembly module TamB